MVGEIFQEQANLKCNQFRFWPELGDAYQNTSDDDRAIEAFAAGVDNRLFVVATGDHALIG